MKKDKALQRILLPDETTCKQSYFPENFTEEEKLISSMVEQFVKEQVIPNIEAMEAYEYSVSRDLFSVSGELGLLGADVPAAYGGLEMGKKTSGLIAEKMGYGASFSVSFNIHSGVGTLPYVYFGTEKQKKRYLPKLSSGEWIGAYALTEPNAGSDALSARASAKKAEDQNGWVLNGEKQWITNAHIANVFVVFARAEEGMTAFIVERSMTGVSIGLEEQKLGIAGSSTATLILENVYVPKGNVLGEVGKGHHIAFNILNLARLKLAFANIGASKQALQLAITYGKEREQFQRKIVNFPMIREKIANMGIGIFKAESAAYYTASIIDSLDESLNNDDSIVGSLKNYAMDCAINKVCASEVLDYVVDEALQIHGGYGYMQEYAVERMYRDARINRIFEGTNEINRVTIAKSFLQQYESDPSIVSSLQKTSKETVASFANLSMDLLYIVLKALPKMDRKMMDDEQESLRLLADILKDIYVLKACILRLNSNSERNISQLIVEVLSEETYREIETATISIVSTVEDNGTKTALLNDMKALPIPTYSNIIAKKRKIALELINNNKYFF